MTQQTQTAPDSVQATLQNQWGELQGAGPRVMELKGDAFAKALSAALDSFANTLSAEYGVDVKELHWTRNASQQASQGR